MDNEFSSLPSKPCCPNLVSLFLQQNPYLRVIPITFFSNMPSLTHLDLSSSGIRSLPDSLFKLINLRVLLIRNCHHLNTLPSTVSQLLNLVELDLQGTKLLDLPDSVKELVNLKSLNVSFYGSSYRTEHNKLPKKLMEGGIISNVQLEQLGIFVFPGDERWEVEVSKIVREVTRLNLTTLYFSFCRIENLGHFLDGNSSWSNDDVTKFSFIVGQDFEHAVYAESMHNSAERCLRFVNGETIPHEVVEVLKRATSFYLDHHIGIGFLSEFGLSNMGALRICVLSDCPKILAIIHQRDDGDILPGLEYFSLNSLCNLEAIIIGPCIIGKRSFGMLKCLSIHHCPKLRFIFCSSMLKTLSKLEELVISDCECLENFIIQDEFSDPFHVFPHLKANKGESAALRNLKVLKVHYTPNLLGFGGCTWPSMEYMSFYDCPRLKNLSLTANDVVNVKEIAAEKAWFMSLEWDEPELSERLGELYIEIQLDDL